MVKGLNFHGNSTKTNETGYYKINLPLTLGEFTISVVKNDIVYEKLNFTIEAGQIIRLDFDINTSIEEEEKEEEEAVQWMDINQIVRDIIDHWYAFVVLIVLLIIIPILLTFLDKLFERIRIKKFRFLDEKSLEFIEKIIRYNILIAFIIILVWLLAIIFPGINESLWQYIAPHIPAIYTIMVLFILMRLFLLILTRVMDYLQGDLSVKPKLKLSPRYIGLLEIILKYLIVLIFSINIIIIALTIFGMGDLIYESFTGFMDKNSGYIVFILLIIVLMYLAARFLGSFIGDMKRKETARISPQVADVVGKVGKIVIYIFGAMIIMFAILQMAQMGDLGQTLILMISMIIGFVVAMAATGSIGNVLSGLVLNAFRPYNIGDRVKIGDTVGDVIGSNLAFVQLETLNSEIIEIPNNTVIADKIINYSKSGAFAVLVDVGIGYNVPNELVRKLLIEAARETKDIEDDPRPNVEIMRLGDYAITYRLKGYTTNAKAMVRVRSNLMGNVQTQFYSHGVEITSPWYLVQRKEAKPTDEEISEAWESTEKRGEEVLEKKVDEKISSSFEMMDKAIDEEKK